MFSYAHLFFIVDNQFYTAGLGALGSLAVDATALDRLQAVGTDTLCHKTTLHTVGTTLRELAVYFLLPILEA